MAVIIGEMDSPNRVHPVFRAIFKDLGMTADEPMKSAESIFHTFDVIDRKTGRTMRMTQIGKTTDYAANTITEYNLKGFDWDNEKLLASVATPEKEAASAEIRMLFPQIAAVRAEIASDQEYWDGAPNKSEYLEMKHMEGIDDLEAKLAKLEERRESLERILTDW